MVRRNNRIGNWESAELNNHVFNDYYTRLKNICINMFEWKNLPSSVREDFLENTLFEKGSAIFFEDDILGFLGMPVMLGGEMNHYNEPTLFTAYSVGYHKQLNYGKAVVIYNNYMKMPTAHTIRLYARRLYNLERSIDANVAIQRFPLMILCDESQRMTMQNLMMQYDGNEYFIFGNKSLDIENIKALQTNAPFVADKLQIQKNQVWNECMTFLGLSNSNTDKKERLVEAEATQNDEQIEAFRNTLLNARRMAATKINEMFGFDPPIEVHFRIKNEPKELGEELENAD